MEKEESSRHTHEESASRDNNPSTLLRKHMDIILKYKDNRRMKANVVSKNIKYFIKK